MKLLDLLVREGVEWPTGVLCATQDYDKDVFLWSVSPHLCEGEIGSYWDTHVTPYHSRLKLENLAEDYDSKVVTKGEYLEAVVLSRKVKVEKEDLSTLTIKCQSQKSLEKALKNVSKEYKQAADETLAKISALLGSVGLEVVERGDLVDLDNLKDGDIVEFVGYSDDTLKHWRFQVGIKYIAGEGGFLRDDLGDRFDRNCYEGFMFKYVRKA